MGRKFWIRAWLGVTAYLLVLWFNPFSLGFLVQHVYNPDAAVGIVPLLFLVEVFSQKESHNECA